MYTSHNPYTGETNGTFGYLSDSELDRRIDASWKRYLSWKRTSVRERAALLMQLAAILENQCDIHARTITMEMGKPISQSVAEVRKCVMACRYYAVNAARFLKPVKMNSPGGRSMIAFDPQGIVLAVMPWNFPYWQVIRCIAPALVAGNTVLLKHASNVPLCAGGIEKALLEAGFPGDCLTNLFIDHRQVERVISSPYVRTLSLTGSNRAGEIIAMKAGGEVKKCILELGGSDPMIIFPDASLERAVDGAITGRFQNSGQSCIATKRIFVHEGIWPEFIHLFSLRVRSMKVGDPMDPSVFIGPLVNEAAVSELASQVERSLAMGAEKVSGGKGGTPGRCFYEPTILVSVPYDSPVAVEETFGPVIPVFTFREYHDLIEHVNASRFGLGSSVWTNNKRIIKRITRDIEAGTVTVNGYTRSDPGLPFGGVKSSGYGRELSDFGIREFVNIRTITFFE